MTERTFDARHYGRALHGLDDRRLGAQLVSMLIQESDGTDWWAVVPHSDGTITIQPSCRDLPEPPLDKRDFALRLAIRLNRDASYNGAWVVWWCEAPDWSRLGYLWKDGDGDMQVVIDTEDYWPYIEKAGLDKWVEDGDAGIRQWVLTHTKLLDRKPSQTFLKALGEPDPSSTH